MPDWSPWILLAALAAGLGVAAGRLAAHLRWVRRTLAGGDAGPPPRDALARVLGLAPIFSAVERRAEDEARARRAHDRRTGELLGRLTQAVAVVDGQDRLRLANDAARRLFRLEAGAEGASFIPAARSADLIDLLRRARALGAAEANILLRRAPLPDLWIRAQAAPAEGDAHGPGAVIVVAEDTTQLRRLQEIEREFLANLSHDLRTPVTILRGYAETLEQDGEAMSAEDRRRFAGKITAATGRLSTMLEGMLALASLEAGAVLRPEPGALARAAEETVEALGERARAEGVALEATVSDRKGRADPLQARRVLQNLAVNALIHARGATLVSIRVEGDEVSVEDDGPGVAQADLGRIFDRLYRADRSRRQGGSGLGLSIVREVAQLHGGWARAEARAPRGLKVTVRLGDPGNTSAPA